MSEKYLILFKSFYIGMIGKQYGLTGKSLGNPLGKRLKELYMYIIFLKVQNDMAIIRPPGHHAMKNNFCGYCYLKMM